MNKTYELKHKKLNPLVGILLIIGILAGLLVLTFLLYLLNGWLQFTYMFFVEFALVIAFAVYLSRKRLIEFTYYLNGDILRIDRIYSARPKLDLFIRMENVIFMGKMGAMPDKYKQHKKQKETFKRMNADAFCVVHLVENKYFTAVLTPDADFEAAVIKAWKDYTYAPKKKK